LANYLLGWGGWLRTETSEAELYKLELAVSGVFGLVQIGETGGQRLAPDGKHCRILRRRHAVTSPLDHGCALGFRG
jgi:hypothetical protein